MESLELVQRPVNSNSIALPLLQNPYRTPSSFSNIASILYLCEFHTPSKKNHFWNPRLHDFPFSYLWHAAFFAVEPSLPLLHVHPLKPAQMPPPRPSSQWKSTWCCANFPFVYSFTTHLLKSFSVLCLVPERQRWMSKSCAKPSGNSDMHIEKCDIIG